LVNEYKNKIADMKNKNKELEKVLEEFKGKIWKGNSYNEKIINRFRMS
jgi:hypothetical protein